MFETFDYDISKAHYLIIRSDPSTDHALTNVTFDNQSH